MTAFPHVRRSLPQGAIVVPVAAADGWPLRSFDWSAAAGRTRGSILWLGGRGDIFEKYFETFVGWHEEGWHVSSFDWRGQGGSGRLIDRRNTGHIEDFSQWIRDLETYWSIWTRQAPAPHVLIGHSMGGHLVLRALVERRVTPIAAVIVAPMLGFADSPVPGGVAARIAAGLARIFPEWRAWRDNERPARPNAPRQAFLTRHTDRYLDELWWKKKDPSLELGPPSWSWMNAAFRSMALLADPAVLAKVATPILLIATEGDRLVSAKAIGKAAAALPDCQVMMFGHDVAHEILRERDDVRDAALERIAIFLDTRAQAPPT